MKRPLIPVALLYVFGILLAALPLSLVTLFVVAFAIVILFAVWPAARTVSLAALIILAGWINLAQRAAVLSPNDLRTIVVNDENIASVRGVLRDTPSHRIHYSHGRTSVTAIAQLEIHELRLAQRDWQPAFGRIIVNTKSDSSDSFYAGQPVEIDGILKIPPGAVAEGLFDYRSYLANQGIYYELSAGNFNDWHIVGATNSLPLADRFRTWARKTLALGLPGEDESLDLEYALTLGWKTALTDKVTEPFIKAATYHIFAVLDYTLRHATI